MVGETLEEKLRNLRIRSSQITDESIRGELEKEINEIKSQNYITSPKPVIITELIPPDLTQMYVKLSDELVQSDIYSTNREMPFFCRMMWKLDSNNPSFPEISQIKGFDIMVVPASSKYRYLSENHYYYGIGANYIEKTIKDNALLVAQKIGADLVIVGFEPKAPHNFVIRGVEGYGKYNFVGNVMASFYKIK